MSREYKIEIKGQPTFWGTKERSQKVYYCEPDGGITESTGILQLIAGYGGNASSNVYKKIRRKFSDSYNLVVLQCDYLGWEFMQNSGQYVKKKELDYDYYSNKLGKSECQIQEIFNKNAQLREQFYQRWGCRMRVFLEEDNDYLNEQGVLQAIDNINALFAVQKIIVQKGLLFNAKKVIVYGHSHGAYLAHLCNIFSHAYTCVIDNSAYIFPYYIDKNRILKIQTQKFKVEENMQYLLKEMDYDRDLYDLNVLYENSSNTAKIVMFQGTADFMTSVEDKKEFANRINNAFIEIVDKSKIDNIIFKSDLHGMNADFLELFKYAYEKYFEEEETVETKIEEVTLSLEKYIYQTQVRVDGVILNRRRNFKKEKETVGMIKSYNPDLIVALGEFVTDLKDRGMSQELNDYLEQIIDGLNWEMIAINSIEEYVSIKGLKIQKGELDVAYNAFGNQYEKQDWNRLAIIIDQQLIPILKQINNVIILCNK